MQTTDTFLMIEPISFGYNAETAQNNYFQINSENENTQEQALEEFNQFVAKLKAHKINVISLKDSLDPHTPDSIFPNNWISFASDGQVHLYPMFAKNRRAERRTDIYEILKKNGFFIQSINDLTLYEAQNIFLEGTGSIIFDHPNRLAYASVSVRMDVSILNDFCKQITYTPVIFHSFQSAAGQRLPIYHTNVMMCVGETFVVICLDSVDNFEEKEMLKKRFSETKKEIIELSESQIQQFAGNMLQVHNADGVRYLVMSQTAYQSLTQVQISQIEKHCGILYSNLDTIEKNGGGSARCMLAEVFLPRK